MFASSIRQGNACLQSSEARMEESSCTARVLTLSYLSGSVSISRIQTPLWSTSRLVLRQHQGALLSSILSRNTLLTDCEHFALPTEIYQSKSTKNGPQSMIRRHRQSMVAVRLWTRPPKSLRRNCSFLVPRQLKTNCKMESRMRSIPSRWPASRSGCSPVIAKRQLSTLECHVA